MNIRKIVQAFIMLTVICGVIVTCYGLHKSGFLKSIPLAGNAINYYIATLLLGAIALAIFSIRGVGAYRATLITSILLVLLSGRIASLFYLVIFVIASQLIGNKINSLILENKNNTSNNISDIFIGIGFYGTLVGILAHFKVNYFFIYFLMAIIPIIINKSKIIYLFNKFINFKLSDDVGPLPFMAGLLFLIYLIAALMPELGYDALTMHLFIPSTMAERHFWQFNPELYVFSVMPLLGDWIFSFLYILGGEYSVRLFNLSLLMIILIALLGIMKSISNDKRANYLLVVLVLSFPITFTESSSLFIDMVFTGYVVMSSIYLWNIFRESSSNGSKNLLLFLIFFGLAFQTKSIILPLSPVFLILLIFYINKYKDLKLNFIGLSIFIAIAIIPYLTAYIITKNPVFPFFNDIFKSEFYAIERFDNALYHANLGLDILYDITFNSNNFLESGIGAPGFQWLIFFPGMLLYFFYERNLKLIFLIVFSLLLVSIEFKFQTYLRYVFFSFLFLAIPLSLFIAKLIDSKNVAYKFYIFCFSVSIFLNLSFLTTASPYRDFPALSIFEPHEKEDFLTNFLPIRMMVELVNKINIKNSPVLVLANPMVAGLRSDALHPIWYNIKIQKLLSSVKNSADMIDFLEKNSVEYIIDDQNWTPYWGTQEIHNLIHSVTHEVAKYGSMRLLRYENSLEKDEK